jgi:sulfur carrier protein
LEETMRVKINGEDLPFVSLVTVAALISQRKIRPETVVVEHNGAILARDRWETTMLKENDTVEILSFVGGG